MPATKNVDASLRHRQELNKLLAINPNYFGNLDNSPFTANLEIIQDTAFEEVSCVGFNPDTDVLEATVQVKLPTGYGGDLCSPGSTEWVRFHISYDEGTTWEDVGLGSFNAHDVPDSVDCHRDKTKPLIYTVAFPLNDAKRQRCSSPVLPLVRAILSWQVQPPVGQPHWNPIWGNHLDRHIQLRPRPSIFRDVVEHLEIDLEKIPDWYEKVLPLPIPEPDPAPFSLVQAAKVAKPGKVPAHRFATPLLAGVQKAGFQDQSVLLAQAEQLKALDIDLGDLLGAFNDNQGDTTYEQINCLGLDYNRDLLVSTLQVKLPSGFSGPPCSAGSVEYVSFWVDYDNTCQWTYLDTAKVVVHDYKALPKDGLNYWVGVPAKTAEHARSCKEPKVGRIRAVLSWSTPPSTTDPFEMPRWGNAIETHIEIPPRRRPPTDDPDIRALGRIPVAVDRHRGHRPDDLGRDVHRVRLAGRLPRPVLPVRWQHHRPCLRERRVRGGRPAVPGGLAEGGQLVDRNARHGPVRDRLLPGRDANPGSGDGLHAVPLDGPEPVRAARCLADRRRGGGRALRDPAGDGGRRAEPTGSHRLAHHPGGQHRAGCRHHVHQRDVLQQGHPG